MEKGREWSHDLAVFLMKMNQKSFKPSWKWLMHLVNRIRQIIT